MGRTQLQRGVVTGLSFNNLSLLLEGISEVAVGIRKVRLQFDGSSVCVNCQVYQTENIVVLKLAFNISLLISH